MTEITKTVINVIVICINLPYGFDKKINYKQHIQIIQLSEGEEWGVFMRHESTPKSKSEQKGYVKEKIMGRAALYDILIDFFCFTFHVCLLTMRDCLAQFSFLIMYMNIYMVYFVFLPFKFLIIII